LIKERIHNKIIARHGIIRTAKADHVQGRTCGMWRTSSRWLLLVVSSLVALGTARTAKADPISYWSWGDVGRRAGVGIGGFDITSSQGTLLTPGTFTLATFQAQNLPDGAALTYTNMPFYIDVMFYPQSYNHSAPSSDLSIEGVLNGTITGTDSSNVVATITSVQSTGLGPLPFSLDSFHVLTPQILAPPSINGGTTPLIGQVTSGALRSPLPEPTPLALAGLLAGYGAYRVMLRRRKTGWPAANL
jgi:hypothetical protein